MTTIKYFVTVFSNMLFLAFFITTMLSFLATAVTTLITIIFSLKAVVLIYLLMLCAVCTGGTIIFGILSDMLND